MTYPYKSSALTVLKLVLAIKILIDQNARDNSTTQNFVAYKGRDTFGMQER